MWLPEKQSSVHFRIAYLLTFLLNVVLHWQSLFNSEQSGEYYFVGSCKAYFFITGNCQFILSFVTLKMTIVNTIPTEVVCSCFAMD